ncbi:uncharacterized protein LOC127506405 [Ctenopharyngodon idella]|uniref:uncharacterized protein LOC127506405 n=1 Tax=Ctenopharyngodon idella TaxID=7959 RepID=UPI00222EFDCE|nr:uncharacterized protein LOC127506405 [Ctenopharyngodon idella]
MLLKAISCILLLIPISTANSDFTVHCEGELTTLSCLDPRNYTESKVEINALWKKGSGERVIWKYYGHTKKGDTFKNRTVNLNDNLSLSIDGCDLSDQGIYIFCINGKPSCEVRLFVKDSNHCKPKTSPEQSTRSPADVKEKQTATDENHQHTETSQPNTYIRWVVYVLPCFVVLIVLLLVVYACIQREETSKNDKSGSKLLHKDIQSSYASA